MIVDTIYSFSDIKNLWKSQNFADDIGRIKENFIPNISAHLTYSFGNNFSFIIDHSKAEIEGISNSFVQTLGYKLKDIKKHGIDFLFSKIHPEDSNKVNSILKKKHATFTSIDIKRRKDLKCTYAYRIRKADFNFIKLLVQDYVIEVDSKGNLVYSLSVCTDISNISLGKSVDFEITIIDDDYRVKSLNDKINLEYPLFSDRELQVLNELSKGKNSKEIGYSLGISMHTVNVHRKNLMKKANVTNVTSLLLFSKTNGILP